ncbi:MAG: endonuclease/exonuclease/phosphatase family protein [Candidatus Marinimicrobia bacterium]|nr:endonuclease/exonuclease/phosphatase family protein [Candidatus Neomarinimicrobiota bacterium]
MKELSILIIALVLFSACEPLVNTFERGQNLDTYQAKKVMEADPPETIRFMTWNIRFGAGRTNWFGDSCGDRVILPESEVKENLQKLANLINTVQPDILFLQEIDIESKRTAYIDQVEWLLNHTHLNYGVYASMWDAQYVPSDGLGRVNTGNAILSRWKIKDAQRIQLPLRSDQDALTQYFYLRRNMLKCHIEFPGIDDFYAVCVHLAAFSTDNTKQKQIEKILTELADLQDAKIFLGGDFNLLPPGSDSLDFCDEDACPDETFHRGKITDKSYHKEGSNYAPEIHYMEPLYQHYNPAVPLERYLAHQLSYFTHSTRWQEGFWDRKIDYLFSNLQWRAGSDSTYQEDAFNDRLSDHVPVSVEWKVEK